jgi:hypothetical protein
MRLILIFIILLHFAIVFGMMASFVILPFKTPWYEALPLMTYIVYLLITPIDCPLTILENKVRRRLGMRPIFGFIGYYIILPIRKFLRRFK